MNKTKILALAALMALALLLAACKAPAPAATDAPTMDPAAVFTAAVQTANAHIAETAAAKPTTAVPPTPTQGLATTAAPATPTPGAATATVPAATVPAGANRMDFVTDVTVPDGTAYAPNATFTKTWRVKNSGTSTWTTAYSLVFTSGTQMGGPNAVPLAAAVAPGQEVDISVNLTAPAAAGGYFGYWMMQDASGSRFGLGPNANGPIYVNINVQGAGATAAATAGTTGTPGTPTATATTGPTATTGVTGTPGVVITTVNLAVDAPTYTGACPHTFTFSAQFTLSQAATVTYKLEAGSDDPNFQINLPPAATTNLSAGPHTLIYTLDFSSTTSGWAQIHFTSPEETSSPKATFSLTCQ